MPTCQSCGGYVTVDFARAFGNDERALFGCPACTSSSAIAEGRAARPDP